MVKGSVAQAFCAWVRNKQCYQSSLNRNNIFNSAGVRPEQPGGLQDSSRGVESRRYRDDNPRNNRNDVLDPERVTQNDLGLAILQECRSLST